MLQVFLVVVKGSLATEMNCSENNRCRVVNRLGGFVKNRCRVVNRLGAISQALLYQVQGR